MTSTSGYVRLSGVPAARLLPSGRIPYDVTLVYDLPGSESATVLVSCEGIELDRARLSELAAALSAWTQLPLDELARTEFALELDLTSRNDQSLSLAFGGRDAPKNRTKVACLVTVQTDRFVAQLPFIADPTALAVFADGLREAGDGAAMVGHRPRQQGGRRQREG
jgi:hypothetical protein